MAHRKSDEGADPAYKFSGKNLLGSEFIPHKTSEFTYQVLPSNIYRSLIGRLFFTLFTVAIMSDKHKQTILDFFGGNKKRKDDDNTQIPLSDNPSDQTLSTSRQTKKLKGNQNLNLPQKSPSHFRTFHGYNKCLLSDLGYLFILVFTYSLSHE